MTVIFSLYVSVTSYHSNNLRGTMTDDDDDISDDESYHSNNLRGTMT